MNANPYPIPAGKIRFAIIGCGHIGLRHARFIQANPDCELVALCDSRPQEELSPDFLPLLQGSPSPVPFFRDEEGLLKLDFDVLVIATPNGLHEGHALLALQNDRHVLIEKPMALTAAGCDNIIRAAKTRDRQVFCVMQLRYSPPSAWLKGLLENRALGRIFFVSVNCFWNRDERYYRKGSWKGTTDLDGGILFTQFSHFVDGLLWLFGDITDIQARFANFSHLAGTSIEDTGTASFNFAAGGMGSFNFTTSVHGRNLESSMTVIGEKGTVRIAGQYMEKLELSTLEGYDAGQVGARHVDTEHADAAGPSGSDRAAPTDARGNHAHIYTNIVSVLKKGAIPDIDPRAAAAVIETIEKIYSRKKPT
jgi:UDP-N-acetyl-2-amino-2-deoxyglucuronate dehydrogenase